MRLRLLCTILLLCAGVAVVGGCARFANRRVAAGPGLREGSVLFRFYAPTARRVQLAGSWPENNWARGDGVSGEANVGLMEDKDGVWEIAVDLPPGRYKYVFWVDETTWRTDPGNPEEVAGGPAGICSLIVLFRQGNEVKIR